MLVHEDLGLDPGAHLGRGLAVGCELDGWDITQRDIIVDITVVHQPMVDNCGHIAAKNPNVKT